MAESTSPKSSSGAFAKKVQRQLSRSKEKVLQRLGKTDETRDEEFELDLLQFNDQQSDGNRIYKDLRNYISAIREMRVASASLSQSLLDVYEADWIGEEDVGAIVEAEELLWHDYEGKLIDQAIRTMESYVSQFPDVREKVAKRRRKLVDYDSSRHSLEALQAAKKRDDIKINKGTEEMNYTKSVYEGINNELKDELPALFDSRIGCYVTVFSAISSLRNNFYKEMRTLNMDLENVLKELQAQHPDKVFAVKGLQRYGSLRRRTLLSPKAWKTSFSEFHRSYSPKPSQRFSFRSPDKSRHGTLTREDNASVLSSSSLQTPVGDPEELDKVSGLSGNLDAEAQSDPAGNEPKSDTWTEEEKGAKEEEAEDEGKAPPGDSSSEADSKHSGDSESLEFQLNAASNGPLNIQESQDDLDQTRDPLENGNVATHNSEVQESGASLKAVHMDTQNSKNTVV